jgi:hypothetical protein
VVEKIHNLDTIDPVPDFIYVLDHFCLPPDWLPHIPVLRVRPSAANSVFHVIQEVL